MSFVKNLSPKSHGMSVTTGFSSPKKANLSFSDTPMNVIHHIAIVQRMIDETMDSINEYKMETTKLRNEIDGMRQNLESRDGEIERALAPFIEAVIQEQSLTIESQKEENMLLQNQISEIKKETAQIQMLILQANKKVANLQEEVGDYTFAKNV